jgi:signal transduction histidine kinase
MARLSNARLGFAIALIASLICLDGRDAAAATTKSVLVLHTYPLHTAFRLPFDSRLAQVVRQNAPGAVDLYFETLEPNRFPGEAHAILFRDYLRQKYADRKIDIVITVWDRALSFALAHRDVLFPEASIVALLTKAQSFSADIPITTIWSGNHVGDSARLALTFHPGTRRIAIIDSTLESNDDVQEESRKQLEPLRDRLEIIYLKDLPLAELLSRIEALPADTILFLTRQGIRTPNQPMDNIEALHEIARVARVPTYGATDRLVGEGLIGGWVLSSEEDATLVAETALRIARGTPVRDIPSREGVKLLMFDWRQLRRWGVPDALLPPGSDVRFREYTFWDLYGRYAFTALAVIGGQAALIAGLLIHRARRRRAEQALRENEADLRASHQEIKTLAGRLIVAQEAERARIGRDLHDDVGQKLALLNIDVTQLDRLTRLEHNETSVHIRQIAQLTSMISNDVQNVSRQLHPGQLQLLGLVPTLRQLCRDMSMQYQPMAIEFEDEQVPRDLAPDVALCVYRVVQEALHNIVKHSGATRAVVRLAYADQVLNLEVTDTGHGFPEKKRAGLGLLSMRERVHFLGGQFTIVSTPGFGTQITAQIPAPAIQGVDREMPFAKGASA